ncbi:MAG: hypothetical protein ACOVSW_19070 [Candidatus Kapaibacteriota bacterium]|jgi:hypothetical protein
MKQLHSTYLLHHRTAPLLAFVRFILPLAALLCLLLPQRLSAQYWHVGIFQGVAMGQRGLSGNSNPVTWMPSLTVHYFPKNNPLVLGGSISMQFFDRTQALQKQGEGFELLAFPISMCFQYLLLPEPPFRPYYGVETGATIYRYRFYDKERLIGSESNVALLVTPNVGLKVEIFEDLDLDLNVRYQFLFHERIEWGSAGQSLQGYNFLAVSLGLNYQLFR